MILLSMLHIGGATLPCLLSGSLPQLIESVLQLVLEDLEALVSLDRPVFIDRHTQNGIKGLEEPSQDKDGQTAQDSFSLADGYW